MDYVTLEVDIDHGKITPKGSSPLPAKASGLLTILHPATDRVAATPFLQTLESLQKHLALDEAGAQQWLDTVRAARR